MYQRYQNSNKKTTLRRKSVPKDSMCTTTATDICDRRYFHSNLKFILKYKVSIRDEDRLQVARKGKIKTFVLRINYSLKYDLIVRVFLFVSKLSGISSICLTKKYNIPMYQRHGFSQITHPRTSPVSNRTKSVNFTSY